MLLLLAKSENKVLSARSPHVPPPVLFSRGDIRHRIRPQFGAASGDRHFKRPLMDHYHFFVYVVMGRMRRAAGRQLGDVKVDRKSSMRLTVEDGPGRVCPADAYREILEAIRLGW